MKLKIIFSSLLIGITTFTFGQSVPLLVQSDIILPKDTIVANHLIKSINGFLNLKEKPNKENSFVLNEDLLETSILLDEMKKIEMNGKLKDNNFYKAYLTNVVQLNNADYLIQVSYIGINENTPVLAACFEILGKHVGSQFYFSSPLKRNTTSWKTKIIGNSTFHFKDTFNEKTATEYVDKITLFDKKLNAKNGKTEWYGCNDMPELLQSIGVTYKLDYNGKNSGTFYANENNATLIVSGSNDPNFSTYDPHDLFHDRARNVIPADKYNHFMVCGCAYIYGGSWGISWEKILSTFKEKMTSDPNTDWLKLYNEGYNFGESEEKHLLVTQLINSLIIKKTEKEKGLSSVFELLSSGNQRKDTESFFKTLEGITGINKTNFNERVWDLIRSEK